MRFKHSRVAFSIATVLLWSGCHREHDQSILHPASSASAEIAWLAWFLVVLCAVVFLAVMALTGVAIFYRPRSAGTDVPQVPSHGESLGVERFGEEHAPRNTARHARPESPLGDRFVLIGGAIIPGVVLLAILLISLRTQVALSLPETALTIEVVGHQWWWEVHYPEEQIEIANELYIPVGEPVRIKLTSADVIHSFWVPNLQGKTDMIPGITNEMWIAANRPGTFRGQCAEYCGVQHALMALVVVAVPREEFDQWITSMQEPTAEPETELQRRGRAVFMEASCNNCHAVADTPAVGQRGPDLTHIGSRRTIGSGVLPNNRGNLAGWISNPQVLKPGNLMPRTHLEPDDLHALVAYLETLK
jgi:cytochrome c oxidase subunit II